MTQTRWAIVASPRGDLTVIRPGHPTGRHSDNWQVLIQINKPFTIARRDYAYRWLVSAYRL